MSRGPRSFISRFTYVARASRSSGSSPDLRAPTLSTCPAGFQAGDAFALTLEHEHQDSRSRSSPAEVPSERDQNAWPTLKNTWLRPSPGLGSSTTP